MSMNWLLLRGLSREQRHFGAFPEEVRARLPGARPFTLDLCGFGTESGRISPRSVAEITDDLRARFWAQRPAEGPWSLLAVSLGGMVALDWAARYPGELERVVVINTSAGDLSLPWERFSPALMARLPALLVAEPAARERAIIEATVNGPLDREALAATWAGYYAERRPHRRSVLNQLWAATRSTCPARLTTPTLVLTSTADRLVRSSCSERIAARLGAPLRVHAAGGHDLTLDAPDWVCAQVAAWVG